MTPRGLGISGKASAVFLDLMTPNTANQSLTFSQAGRGGIAWRGVGRKSNLRALPQRPCNQGSTWAHLFNRMFVEPDTVPGTENEHDACPDGGYILEGETRNK